jgi:hypothetical protein
MLVRSEPSGLYRSLQASPATASDGTGQRVLATPGRMDQLVVTGAIRARLRPLGRCAERARVIDTDRHGQ